MPKARWVSEAESDLLVDEELDAIDPLPDDDDELDAEAVRIFKNYSFH